MGSAESMFSEVLKQRVFLRHLVLRELRQRYAGSWLGPLWTIVHPLFLMSIYLVVFSWILGPRVSTGLQSVPFGVFLVSGYIPWLGIQDTVTRSTATMTENAPLIRQNAFPTVLLPIQVVITALGNQLLLAGLFAVICLASGMTTVLAISWLIPAVLVQFVLLLGIAMIVSVVSPIFRDIGQAVHLLLTVTFFATPIVYPLSAVPAWLVSLIRLNPVLGITSLYRQAFIGASAISLSSFLYAVSAAVLIMVGGGFVFNRLRTTVVDVL